MLISADAGINVGYGLPGFRGDEGFWRTCPPLAEARVKFADIASPAEASDCSDTPAPCNRLDDRSVATGASFTGSTVRRKAALLENSAPSPNLHCIVSLPLHFAAGVWRKQPSACSTSVRVWATRTSPKPANQKNLVENAFSFTNEKN
ncbi:hypothetical protein [Massilia sp. S19_KUP03_FR1]|uniref:hypothetical protein n=1 Tax=Massilia sp. S19_KUP03_FR1 TaxID=3025503 RepID=UPI002FCDC13B